MQNRSKFLNHFAFLKKNTQTQKDLFGLSYLSPNTLMQKLEGSAKFYTRINVCTLGLFIICVVAAPRGFGGGLGAFHLWDLFCFILRF